MTGSRIASTRLKFAQDQSQVSLFFEYEPTNLMLTAWKRGLSSPALLAVNSIHEQRDLTRAAVLETGDVTPHPYRRRRFSAAMKSQRGFGLLAFVATLAACSVNSPKPAAHEVRITHFKQGLMRQDPDGKWHVYDAGNQFPYAVNGECIVNHTDRPCMWRGFEFDFTVPDAHTELSCITRKGSGSLDANPNFISDHSSSSLLWSLTLNGRSGTYQNPQYIIMAKSPRESDTDSTTCTFEGKAVLQFTSTILAEKPAWPKP